MEADDITQKIKDVFKKTATATKSAFEKAGEKVQDISDKNAVRMEIHKLEKDVSSQYEEMGKVLYKALCSGAKIDLSNTKKLPESITEEAFLDFQTKIKKLKNQITEKEALLTKAKD